jgi:hypothetical protein
MSEIASIFNAIRKWIDPDLGLPPTLFAYEYKCFGNTPQDDQVFTGRGVVIGWHCQVPGSTGAKVTIKDTSNGTDGATLWEVTNPTAPDNYVFGPIKFNHGLRVTTTNGGAGAAPVITIFYKRQPQG